jgi:hypothetical protein
VLVVIAFRAAPLTSFLPSPARAGNKKKPAEHELAQPVSRFAPPDAWATTKERCAGLRCI